MAILYSVKVKSINIGSKLVELEIKATHPDSMYYSDNLGFAIRLLHDSIIKGSELAKILDLETVLSETWMQNNAKGIIATCELNEVNAPEPQTLKNNGSYSYWFGEVSQSSARLTITTTHTAWLEHLSSTSTWDSTACDAEVDFKACNPITPNASEEEFSSDLRNSGGWVIAKSKNISEYDASSWPDEVFIPKYSEKSYKRGRKIARKDLTKEILSEMLFKTVFMLTRYDKSFGIFVPFNDERFGVIELTSTGKSGCFVDFDGILAIGLAEFNVNDPLKAEVYNAQDDL